MLWKEHLKVRYESKFPPVLPEQETGCVSFARSWFQKSQGSHVTGCDRAERKDGRCDLMSQSLGESREGSALPSQLSKPLPEILTHWSHSFLKWNLGVFLRDSKKDLETHVQYCSRHCRIITHSNSYLLNTISVLSFALTRKIT